MIYFIPFKPQHEGYRYQVLSLNVLNYKVNMKEERTTSCKLQTICDEAVGLIFNSDDSIYDRLEALEGVADRVNMMVDKLQEKIDKETSVSNILQVYHSVSVNSSTKQ